MKAIKHILFIDRDDRSLNPLFKAILEQAMREDPVLSAVGLKVDTAGIDRPGKEVDEGKPPKDTVHSALNSLGIHDLQHASKDIRMQSELLEWADLILVPGLLQEDVLCDDFHEAWSKTLPVECYCGEYEIKTDFMTLSTSDEATEKDYLSAAETFRNLLPGLVCGLKDSYVDAQIAKGICITKGTASGKAYIAKYGQDLYDFTKGDILVVDRPGVLMFKDLDHDRAMATKIIKKFADPSTAVGDLQDVINHFVDVLNASLKGEHSDKNVLSADGLGAFQAVMANVKALVCSRGRHTGEHTAMARNIPCISSCPGATDRIGNGQRIVVDAERGVVYDASLLCNLP